MGRKGHQEPRRLRVYQQWQGNERFFCWGHCVTGPSWKSGMGSLALLIAPTVVFLVFIVPYMAQRVSPVIWVVSCILPVFCASMLLLTSCRDPGILPRQEPDEEWLQSRKPRTTDVNVNGHRVTVRYNDTCHFYQPPRAHHCSVNDNCIERFDHHCPWVGTTIGKRNYRTFLLFIYSTSLYIAWTFGVSLGSLFVKHQELEAAAASAPQQQTTDSLSNNLWLQTLSQSGPALALMIFSFIFFWFVCGLSGFHTWLVATNQTTYENFRYNHNQVPNPYSEGLLRNCASVWCVRVSPSKVQFRAYLDEVVRQPVELGYPEWSPPQQPSPFRSGNSIEMSQQQPGSALGVPSGMAAGAAPVMATGMDWSTDGRAAMPSADGDAGPLGGGGAVAVQIPSGRVSPAAGLAAGPYAAMTMRSGASPQQQQLPPAAAAAAQSFESITNLSAPPISRNETQGYSSSTPPQLGPSYPQRPLGAGAGLEAGQQPMQQSSGSSNCSGPYYSLAPSVSTQQQQQQQQHPSPAVSPQLHQQSSDQVPVMVEGLPAVPAAGPLTAALQAQASSGSHSWKAQQAAQRAGQQPLMTRRGLPENGQGRQAVSPKQVDIQLGNGSNSGDCKHS